ncbi:MAG TPA: hypothetical protein VFG98_12135 [Intrasporangium sp.]|nr:hypothetical protein [Intrasporangium sp.]
MLEHLDRQGLAGRLDLVLVDRGVTAATARTLGRHHDVEVRRIGWDDKQRPAGFSSPASRLRGATSHASGLASADPRWRRDRPPAKNRAKCGR